MNRTNFAHASGVILDVCKGHGVWLDRGELQRVLDFVGDGGLAVARERERVKLAEEKRKVEEMKANLGTSAAPQPMFQINVRQTTDEESESAHLLGTLLKGALALVAGNVAHF